MITTNGQLPRMTGWWSGLLFCLFQSRTWRCSAVNDPTSNCSPFMARFAQNLLLWPHWCYCAWPDTESWLTDSEGQNFFKITQSEMAPRCLVRVILRYLWSWPSQLKSWICAWKVVASSKVHLSTMVLKLCEVTMVFAKHARFSVVTITTVCANH